MAMPSNNNNKSSPLPSNPNPRSSEISNPMRRSFTGNPFSKPSLIANPRTSFTNTPANSPSDFPRKSSVGIRDSGGSLRDIVDDKENAKDQILKPSKIRSPAASPSSKTTKNFMSPTISASFKVAESPRKKILSDRNEVASPILTPTPSSDPKIHARKVTFADPLEQKKLDVSLDGSVEESCGDLSDETLNDVNVIPLIPNDDLSFQTMHFTDMNVPLTPKIDTDLSFEPVHDLNVPLIQKNDFYTESSFETVPQAPDLVNLDPTFKLSPIATPPVSTPPVSSMASVLAPLDADPSMPPYDPKTNYLSPRPQFLHYKPKPRMEFGSSQRELEEALLSGSFSDTEVNEDTQSEGSQMESEDASSEEIVEQEEGQISEPSSLPEKEVVEAKEGPKPRFSMRSKLVALILLLSVAFASISVIKSPRIDHTVLEDFYDTYESSEFPEFARANFGRFSQFATANLDGLARNLHILFTKSLSSISELISSVRGSDNLQYFNLTILHDYSVPNQYPIFGRGETEISHIHPPVQESDAASEIGTDQYIEDISAEHYESYEEQLQQDIGITTGVENAWDALEFDEVLGGQPATMIESEKALQLAEVEYLDAKVAQEIDASSVVEDASESEEVLESQPATLIVSEHEAANSEENQTQEDADSSTVENKQSSNWEAAEIHNEVCGEGNIETKQAQGNDANLNVAKNWPDLDSEVATTYTTMYDDDEAVVESDAAIRGDEQILEPINTRPSMVLYLLLFVGTVFIAGATFSWSKKVRSKNDVTSSEEQPKNAEFLSEKNKQTFQDKPSLRNGPIELDVLGESCPSEMSSFENEKSSSYSRKVVSEANNVEKKRRSNHNRRESLASSSDYSMGSPSYGSLTVYERIPKGRGEKEIVTPVRRSSRIRSIATSPV